MSIAQVVFSVLVALPLLIPLAVFIIYLIDYLATRRRLKQAPDDTGMRERLERTRSGMMVSGIVFVSIITFICLLVLFLYLMVTNAVRTM